jgi:hypothetical protein
MIALVEVCGRMGSPSGAAGIAVASPEVIGLAGAGAGSLGQVGVLSGVCSLMAPGYANADHNGT